MKKLNTQDFIEIARGVHGDLYDYSGSKYVNARTYIDIRCKVHGLFKQLPRIHTSQGSGCPDCGGTKKLSQSTFLEKCNEVHNNKYDYSKTIYSGMNKKITITCKDHGDFIQEAVEHYRGRGCIKCARMSMGYGKVRFLNACKKNNGNALIYLLRCTGNGEDFYKIGITSKTVKSRTINIPYDSELVSSIIDDGLSIFMAEKELHRKLKEYKYKPKIEFCGQTECFSEISSEVAEFFGVAS